MTESVVTIWMASPSAVGSLEQRPRALAVLSHDERTAIQELRFERDREVAIASYALQRFALSRALGQRPESLQFVRIPSRRPQLVSPSQVAFSASRTAGMVICAVASRGALGADVERIDRKLAEGVIDALLAPSERAAVLALPPHQRTTRLFELWALKEAYAKATGIELRTALGHTVFAFSSSGAPHLVTAPQRDQRWDIYSWAPTTEHRAATICGRGSDCHPLRFELKWACGSEPWDG